MELIYTATRPRRSSRRDFMFREETPIISLSTRNALALCTTISLNDIGSNVRYVYFISISNSLAKFAKVIQLNSIQLLHQLQCVAESKNYQLRIVLTSPFSCLSLCGVQVVEKFISITFFQPVIVELLEIILWPECLRRLKTDLI